MSTALTRLDAVRLASVLLMNQPDQAPPDNWRDWIAATFSEYLWPPYASYHEEFWEWAWSIEAGRAQEPFVAIWPRGFAKSTSVEVACALMAGEGKRRYALYVCDTQNRADDHVQTVAGLLESETFSQLYPDAAARKFNKFGSSKGWRRNRLRTASGFTLDAIGLDTASRGAKIDGDRPDLLIFDDIDAVLDSPGTTAKKIITITKSILPARAAHAVVLVAQNLIHEDGIVARLADGRADFLTNRIVSGPHPAIEHMAIEQQDGRAVIVAGEPTWPAMGIPELQAELDDIGITSFTQEKQHEVGNVTGSIFEHVAFRHCRWDEVPELAHIVVWVDPAVTDTDQSDAHGIQADGITANGHVYRLYSWEQRASPEEAVRRAILKAIELEAECVGIETDQGGDTWKSTYNEAWTALVDDPDHPEITKRTPKPKYREDKAGRGHGSKSSRASQMLVDYERGLITHVLGTHDLLERGLRRYLIRKPFDLVDAAFWSWHDLKRQKPKTATIAPVVRQESKWKDQGAFGALDRRFRPQ